MHNKKPWDQNKETQGFNDSLFLARIIVKLLQADITDSSWGTYRETDGGQKMSLNV